MRTLIVTAAVAALTLLGACSQQVSTPMATPAASPSAAVEPVEPVSAESAFQQIAENVPTAKLGVVYTEANDPNHLLGRPNGYTSKVAFSDSRIELPGGFRSDAIEAGGSVEVYPTAEGAMARMQYVQEIGKAAPMFGEYTYVSGTAVLRVSRVLTPNQAKEL